MKMLILQLNAYIMYVNGFKIYAGVYKWHCIWDTYANMQTHVSFIHVSPTMHKNTCVMYTNTYI